MFARKMVLGINTTTCDIGVLCACYIPQCCFSNEPSCERYDRRDNKMKMNYEWWPQSIFKG